MPVQGQDQGAPKPRVLTIPPDLPFLDTLALALPGLVGSSPHDPLAPTRATVLLPTRRACRAFRDAILRTGTGDAALLPRILPLGNLDADDAVFRDDLSGPLADSLDIPPAIGSLDRLCLLARLVLARDPSMTPAQAVFLATDLAALLDQVHTEGLSLEGLGALVDHRPDFAEHWQKTVDFLAILTQVWPTILAAQDALDPAHHRNRVLEAQAAAWQRQPPTDPIIAAGSTGSIPATATLLGVIARLPKGLVVLPGLDTFLDEDSWAALEDTHPQAGLKRLIASLDLDRADIGELPVPHTPLSRPGGAARSSLLSLTFRPAETTDFWRTLKKGDLDGALDGVTLLKAPTQRDEASTIALLMRETLETPGRTVALVTPDRVLGRRVASALGRWGITVDDSAGLPLSNTNVGLYLRLSAQAAAAGLAPVALLSFLDHPLTAGGEAPGRFRARIRRLNRDVLRGPKPALGLDGLRAHVGGIGNDRLRQSLLGWLDRFGAVADPFLSLFAQKRVDAATLIDAHMRFAEDMAAAWLEGALVPGATRLWAGDAGEVAAGLMADLGKAAESFDPFDPQHYPAFLDTFLSAQPVRPKRDTHPNLFIWGPLEARLQRPDLVILGSLNEGTWPSAPETGPWLSRPMLDQLGLPQPERRIGLSAHDVSQALHAPEVVLSRSDRVEGSPTVASRWLTRLETVARAADLSEDLARARQAGDRMLLWARSLERPDGPPQRTVQPRPCPPVAARPRTLSVTRIETWMRDPYAIYARFILGLKELDPLEADPTRAAYGTVIHAILEDFVRDCGDDLPQDPMAHLLRLGARRFADPSIAPGVRAFWEPRFQSIARWVAHQEQTRAPLVAQRFCEISGEMSVPAPAGPFRVTAKADRVDLLKDGGIDIIDYKTGTPPSSKEVAAGFAPQLPLEAAIAASGGFAALGGRRDVSALAYWQLKGGRDGGLLKDPTKSRSDPTTPSDLAAAALDGLSHLVATFDDPATPYLARPHPDHAPRFNPYQHLARVAEWASDDDGGDAS